MNHFINISDLNKDELRSIIDSAKKKKSERGKKSASQPDNDQPLQGKNMIMIFEKLLYEMIKLVKYTTLKFR